jgi:hypothetical protein
MNTITKEQSKRLHCDWWGQCRTCRHWNGKSNGDGSDRRGNEIRWQDGNCENPASPLYQQETTTDGHCRKWDTFDIETALEIMEDGERIK